MFCILIKELHVHEFEALEPMTHYFLLDSTLGSLQLIILGGPEGVKWELGFAFFRGWEMGFCALGLGFMKQKQ